MVKIGSRTVTYSTLRYVVHSELSANHTLRVIYFSARKLLRLKPVLSYLEVQLVDYCNLNCRGCSHYSPIADKTLQNPEDYKSDLKRLSKLISNIKTIRLLGGEPLLHPEIAGFIETTRAYFPKADIRVVTNGILLSEMAEGFWVACKKNSVGIDVTLYPPLKEKGNDFSEICKEKGVACSIYENGTFRVTTNGKGDSDLGKTFKGCRKKGYWPFLYHGKIYPCSKPALGHYFNTAFAKNIPSTGFIDIYRALSGYDVLLQLEKAPEACCYCTYGWKKVPTQPWAKSSYKLEEWDAGFTSFK